MLGGKGSSHLHFVGYNWIRLPPPHAECRTFNIEQQQSHPEIDLEYCTSKRTQCMLLGRGSILDIQQKSTAVCDIVIVNGAREGGREEEVAQ